MILWDHQFQTSGDSLLSQYQDFQQKKSLKFDNLQITHVGITSQYKNFQRNNKITQGWKTELKKPILNMFEAIVLRIG